MGGALSKCEFATKVSVFPLPTPAAIVYGVVSDRNDFIYRSSGTARRITVSARAITETSSRRRPTPRTCSAQRGLRQQLLGGSLGGRKRPRLDKSIRRPAMDRVRSHAERPAADVSADRNNIWARMSAVRDAVGFNTRDEDVHVLSKPQRGGFPKIQITKGRVRYSLDSRESTRHRRLYRTWTRSDARGVLPERPARIPVQAGDVDQGAVVFVRDELARGRGALPRLRIAYCFSGHSR